MLGKAIDRPLARDASAPLLVLCKALRRSIDGLACQVEDATHERYLIGYFLLGLSDLLSLRRLLRLLVLRCSPRLLLLVGGRRIPPPRARNRCAP